MSFLHALVILLLTLFTLKVAGDCNIYNNSLSSTAIDRCYQLQKCVNAAFFNNGKNLYILDKVFRSTESHSPIALIVNYQVKVVENRIIVTDHNGSDSGKCSFSVSGSASGSCEDETYLDVGSTDESNWTATDTEEGIKPTEMLVASYIEQLGWGTTGIYTAIRPVVLIALQPVWFWWTVGFAIDNYGFPRSIHLQLNIASTTECNILKDITRSEIKEALQHLTMNLNYNNTGKAVHLWNTDPNSSLQSNEILLFVTVVSLVIFTLTLLTASIPKLDHYTSKLSCDCIGIGFALLAATAMVVESMFHLHFTLTVPFIMYTNIRVILTIAIPTAAFFGGIYWGLATCCVQSCSLKIFNETIGSMVIYVCATCSAVYILPMLIEAFIYPTEIISTIGFMVTGIASISAADSTLMWLVRMRYSKKSASKKNCRIKCFDALRFVILSACAYISIPLTIYAFLVLYLSLLKLRIETPGGQLFQILLAIISTASAGFGSFIIKQKVEHKKKVDLPKETTELDEDGHCGVDEDTNHIGEAQQQNESDQPQDTTNTNKQTQPERGQLQNEATLEIETQHNTDESSPQEMQVIVEVEHQDNTVNVDQSVV